MGRSYGDSALADQVISTTCLNHLLDFDLTTGSVRCSAGVPLVDLIEVFVPRGWFPPVTPGTQFVTVGGAIASDVHGKNHHGEGCFSELLEQFQLMLASGEVVTCSKDQNAELFRATCGGMGLTGIIVEATLRLRPIRSAFIKETIFKAKDLEEVLALFEEHQGSTYAVAWIDCLAAGRQMGRSLLMLGEHDEEGGLIFQNTRALSIPIDMPGLLLNRFSIAAFNAFYYHRVRTQRVDRRIHYEPFFYPLDNIRHWNLLYGRRGFVQYQFVIPKAAGIMGLRKIFQKIVATRRGSFLAVLKVLGNENANYLSFPTAGYTLAIDFKLDDGLFAFLEELDKLVLDYGGRIFLTKDARMSEATFKRGYPQWEQFQEIRHRYGAMGKFCSLQSKRLGL
jgi:FAD/FMN-containing dehydrogenase